MKKVITTTTIILFLIAEPGFCLRPASYQKSAEQKAGGDLSKAYGLADDSETERLVSPLIAKIREMDYSDDPRAGFILEKETFGSLLEAIAVRLLSFYETADYDRYDYWIKSIVSILASEGFSERAIIEIIGEGKVWPAPSAGIIDVAISILRERSAQEDGPGAVALIKRIAKNQGKILEIGPGKGEFIKALMGEGILPANHEEIMQAIDNDEEQIAKAKDNGVTVINKNATTLDASFGAFDMVFIGYPETFDMRLFDDIFMRALSALKPGGLLVILSQHAAAIDNHFFSMQNVIKHSRRLVTEQLPRTEWTFKTTYQYTVVKALPTLYSGDDIKKIIEEAQTRSRQNVSAVSGPSKGVGVRQNISLQIQSAA
ncbi:class I SAM-dependent methyltransferase [Candidatus Omnitrophota bacterium]